MSEPTSAAREPEAGMGQTVARLKAAAEA